MPVDEEPRTVFLHETNEGLEPLVRTIRAIVDTSHRRVRDKDVQRSSVPEAIPAQSWLHATDSGVHLTLRVLVSRTSIEHRPARATYDPLASVADPDARHSPVDVDRSLRILDNASLGCGDRTVVVPSHEQQGHPQHREDELEIRIRQVPARDDQVNVPRDLEDLPRVEGFNLDVAQCKDSHARSRRLYADPAKTSIGLPLFLGLPRLDASSRATYSALLTSVKEVNVAHQKGDQALVRSQNRALVINLLRTSGPLSRADIAKLTGLAPSALTRLVRGLLEEGVVKEMGKATSRGGRPATLVRLNRAHASSIGIKIERRRILAARVDLGGAIAARAECEITDPPDPAQTLDAATALVARLTKGNILGVGVCVSGFVDPVSGANLYSPILRWENVEVRSILGAQVDVPVHVENDVNALALAESWYGAGRDFAHFVCVTVGEGIGSGVVIAGDLYRGAFGGAGELGHMTIDPNGPVCRCRERGCLEVYASDQYLLEEAHRLSFRSVEAMAQAARADSAEARTAFRQMGTNLGIGVKNLINLLNPEAIVLGGERMDDSDLFSAAFEEEVCRHSFPAEAAKLRILPAQLGRDGFLIGAATAASAEFFRLPAQAGVP